MQDAAPWSLNSGSMEKTCPFCVPGSFGEVSLDEQGAMLAMLQRVRAMLDAELRPDGYNIGINDGTAAGQTVMHVHMHVIPRYRGDRPDPRGGIRWIIPEKADYWSGRGE